MHAVGKLAIFIVASTGCLAQMRVGRFDRQEPATASETPTISLGGDPDPEPARAVRGAPDPMPREELDPRVASAAAADAIVYTRGAVARAELPASHRLTVDSHRAVATADDVRALVGRRDKRDPIATAIGWARELAAQRRADGGPRPPAYPYVTEAAERCSAGGKRALRDGERDHGKPCRVTGGAELVAWAERESILHTGDAPIAGDVVVFDRALGDDASDLVAVVLAVDARGVAEFAYLGGGVVRRGFVDTLRPALHRDADGAVVNTYLRHGKRWPPKGTHYLAGELLAHVIR